VGINAHLNSLLQTPGSDEQASLWYSFHSRHVTHIADALNERLPRNYIAFSEQSLQIHGYDDIYGISPAVRPRPDVTIFQRQQTVSAVPALSVVPDWQAILAEVIEPLEQPRAVVIREVASQGKIGHIITRIELLSPSNKPGSSSADAYAVRRVEAIDSGAPLIEIDYLHEQKPVVARMPRYPAQAHAYPYWIIVSDPRPNWQDGKVQGFGFHVGDAIKSFPVPLAGSETLIFDLNAVYQHTFRAGRWGDLLDYAHEPERFHTYSAEDRVRIRAIMESVANDSNGTTNGK
jgi:hypothetical protein